MLRLELKNRALRVALGFAFAVVIAFGATAAFAADGTAGDQHSSNGPLLAVHAGGDNAASSGTWGTCAWQIDDDGVLTVFEGTGDGAQSLSEALGSSASSVESVKFSGTVMGPANCSGLFSGLENAEAIDLRGFDTSQTTDISAMFLNCFNLESVNVKDLDLSQVTDMSLLFYCCSELESIDLSNLDLPNLKEMSAPFYGCSSLENVNLSGLNLPLVEDLQALFYGCESLETADLSGMRANVLEDMRALFYNCTSLEKANLSGMVLSELKSMGSLFYDCSDLESADLSQVKAPVLDDVSALFFNCDSLENVNLDGFTTSSVTQMGAMFSGCDSVEFLDLSKLDTSSAKVMLAMFNGCSSLEALDISGFNTSSVEDMGALFFGCSSLKDVDVSSFNTSKVRNMIALFANCTSMRVLDISNFDTSHVPDSDAATGPIARTLAEHDKDLMMLDVIPIPTELGFTVEFADVNERIMQRYSLPSLPSVTVDIPNLEAISQSSSGSLSNMFANDDLLEHVTLGEKTKPLGMLPSFPLYGNADWRSEKANAWFTSEEINSKRLGIRDVYEKYPDDRQPIEVGNGKRSSSRYTTANTGDGLGVCLLCGLAVLGLALVLLNAVRGVRRRRR